MYDVHRLRLLRELKLRGTLAAVAQALGYSPSAISHQLTLLEREVGVRLTEPRGRRVRLTDAAERLVTHTEAILRELERAEAAMVNARGDVAGGVRIAAFQTAGHALIPDVLTTLERTHPRVRISFSHIPAQAALPALLARDFDIVVYEEYPGDPIVPGDGVTTRTLASDPILLTIPSAWSASSLAELAGMPWVMEPAGSPAREWTTRVCRTAGFEPLVAFETTDVLLHTRLVTHGRAAAFVPRLAHQHDAAERVLPTAHARSIAMAVRRGSESNPTIGAVRDALRAHPLWRH